MYKYKVTDPAELWKGKMDVGGCGGGAGEGAWGLKALDRGNGLNITFSYDVFFLISCIVTS